MFRSDLNTTLRILIETEVDVVGAAVAGAAVACAVLGLAVVGSVTGLAVEG